MNPSRMPLFRPAAGAVLLALGGCGFHLAGDRPLPPALSSVYIDMAQPYSVTTPPLETALQSRLTGAGSEVKSHSGDAKSVLRLSQLAETREVLSIGPDGKVNEYRLVTTVTYELHSGSHELVSPETQGVSRSYSFSLDEILGKEAEETRLRNFMQDELAGLILLRIEAELARAGNVGVSPEPNNPPPAEPPAQPPAVVPVTPADPAPAAPPAS